MASSSSNLKGFYFENVSCLKNEDEGIRISPLVKDKELISKIHGINSVYDIFKDCLSRQPKSPFLGWHDSPASLYQWMTYEEANEKVESCGSYLLQLPDLKTKSTKCVGIYAVNSPYWMLVELACFTYGLVVIPLYDTLGLPATRHIFNETELSVVFCDTSSRVSKLLEARSSTPSLKCIVVFSPDDKLDDLRSVAGEAIEIIAFSDALMEGRKKHTEPTPLDENGLIMIAYTSGTTGTPKGAMIRNRNLLTVLAASKAILGQFVTKDDVILSFLPLAHIYEQFVEIYLMYEGGRIGYFSGNISKLKDDMQSLHPTVFTSVPRLLYRLFDLTKGKVRKSPLKKSLLKFALKEKCRKVDKQIYKLNTVWDSLFFSKIRQNFGGRIRLVLLAGAGIDPSVLRFTRAVFSCPVLEGYGCTESCGLITMAVAGDLKGGITGVPMPSSEVKVIDVPEMNLVAARDNKGEICVRSASCIDGYYKNPELTSKLIDKDGWLHTGDVGVWQDGCLKIVDRCKHIFKLSQGEYVAPMKLEEVFGRSTLVNQIFVDGSSFGAYPVALVIPKLDNLRQAIFSKRSSGKNDGTEPSRDDEDRSLEAICRNPAAKKLILEDLKRHADGAGLMGFEKVKNITLVAEAFSIENGMLTPTQKIARNVVRAYYAEELSKLFKAEPAI
ncbi:hypothetical protein Aperf_G00000006882 [Anoplocephala perfoliata]